MKSYIQLECSENTLSLMPCRIKNIKELKYDIPKDLNQIVTESENKNVQITYPLAPTNINLYNLKHTYKDKRKIKDAVTVKKMNLVCKQNNQNKRMPILLNFIRRKSLNFSLGNQVKRKTSQQLGLRIIKKKVLPLCESLSGYKTSNNISPTTNQERKPTKLQRVEKQNDFSQTIFETKPLQTNSKSQILINTKLRCYLKSYITSHSKLQKTFKRKVLRVRIKRGNNSQLIKWLFKKRWWWTIQDQKEIKQKNKVNFIWSQLKQKSFFQKQADIQHFQKQSLSNQTENSNQLSTVQIQCHNHFPQNQYLGNKKALFYNMSYYYKNKGIDVFQNLPLTYHVTSLQDQSWKKFTQKYLQLQKNNLTNIWILKPGENSNRGRGITMHQSYQQIKSIVGCGQTFVDHHDSKTKKRTYIIQLYIDKPFLYNRRKFDIRCYMLLVNINKSVKGYWYTQGYIRTSSFQFQLNDFNSFVHLTNDAIQNHSENYGKYEQGNKVSYTQFQKYLDAKYAGCGYDLQKQIVPKMKEIATDSIKASINLIKNSKYQKPVFEIFGLDFMIDKNFRPWLIQINTNPCIQTSCLVLQKIIPRMLDDSLKLSLDLLFPPPENWPATRKHCLPSSQNKFQLVYQESLQQKETIQRVQFPSLGVITQDGQVYDQKQTQQ